MRYEIIAEHGRGGLGRVLRARDTDLGRDVAIKECLSRTGLNDARFLREALITARLEHPGIVPVYEAGYWPSGIPFYAMKLISGRPLSALIAERGAVDERIKLLHHVIAVADTMAYAHAQNVIHRDLKPGNVIVGDYGETVVIDWGLAKQVSENDPHTATLTLQSRDEGLTSAGSVLGTPAYMAPEQARGDRVDQRADVFAIGAILWELCSLSRVPPAELQQRRRSLHSVGIDEDLATIIEKALHLDPEHRYPHAGELAADLRAFKAGSRIAARRYSPFALLARWTRRHRALAGSIGVAISAVIGLAIFHVETIAAERDRANEARISTSDALDEVLLKNAQLLLSTDPSAAADTVMTYQGPNRVRAQQILAEAKGHGVAVLRARPHINNVIWATAAANGDVLSLSIDGTISKTSSNGSSQTIARNIGDDGLVSYSNTRNLLAYECSPPGICLWNVAHEPAPTAERVIPGLDPVALSLSPSGRTLAALSTDGAIYIYNTEDEKHPKLRVTMRERDSDDVRLLDDDNLVISTPHDIRVIHANESSRSVSIEDNSQWTADASLGMAAIGTTRGDVYIVQAHPTKIVSHATPCQSTITGLALIPQRLAIAYACRDGVIGTLDVKTGKQASQFRLAGQAGVLAANEDQVFAASSDGSISRFDLRTGIAFTYRGHTSRLTFISPPTSEHPFWISGDARGAIRTWQLPAPIARVVSKSPFRYYYALFAPGSSHLVATSGAPTIAEVRLPVATASTAPHDPYNLLLASSTTNNEFVAYGTDTLEFWSFDPVNRTRTIASGHGSILRAHFTQGGDLLTAGRDGRIARWHGLAPPQTFAKLANSIDDFTILDPSQAVLAATSAGAIWKISPAGLARSLSVPGARVTKLVTGARDLAFAGFSDGSVVRYDPGGTPVVVLNTGGPIDDMAVNSDAIVVASSNGSVYVGHPDRVSVLATNTDWLRLPAQTRSVALTSDGLVIIPCTNGLIWIFSSKSKAWLNLPTASVSYSTIAVSPDQTRAIAVDADGRMFEFDLSEVRKQFDKETKN